MNLQAIVRKLLKDRFQKSKVKNPLFSLRAFARTIGTSPTSLSLILNNKRQLSFKLVDKISKNLLLEENDRELLLNQLKIYHADRKQKEINYLQLKADQYESVANWHAFALLGLIETIGFKNHLRWIAVRLGLSVSEVRRTIDRLKRLGMLIETDQKELKRATPRYDTSDDISNQSLRKSHYQTLDLARQSLDCDRLENRYFTWITLPLDLKKMKTVKTIVRKFQDRLVKELGTDAEPTEVYRMAIQFFPITKFGEGS